MTSTKSFIALNTLKRGGSKPTAKKADHRADTRGSPWVGIPHAVLKSLAYRHLSLFARALLFEIVLQFTGYNNSEIALSQRQAAARLNNSNYRKIGHAFAELMEHGLIDVAVEGTWHPRRARLFRLTFVSAGKGKHIAATNDYISWSPDAHSSAADPATRDNGSADDVSTLTHHVADDVKAEMYCAGEQPVFGPGDDVTTLISNHNSVTKEASQEIDATQGLACGSALVGWQLVGGIGVSSLAKRPEWPKGTPLGGKFMSLDAEGFPMPPQVGSPTNQEHQVQANGMYIAAKAEDWRTFGKLVEKPIAKFKLLGGQTTSGLLGTPGAQIAWPSKETKGGSITTQDKWSMQKLQYAQALIDAPGKVANVTAKVDRVAGPADLSTYKIRPGRSLHPRATHPAKTGMTK